MFIEEIKIKIKINITLYKTATMMARIRTAPTALTTGIHHGMA